MARAVSLLFVFLAIPFADSLGQRQLKYRTPYHDRCPKEIVKPGSVLTISSKGVAAIYVEVPFEGEPAEARLDLWEVPSGVNKDDGRAVIRIRVDAFVQRLWPYIEPTKVFSKKGEYKLRFVRENSFVGECSFEFAGRDERLPKRVYEGPPRSVKVVSFRGVNASRSLRVASRLLRSSKIEFKRATLVSEVVNSDGQVVSIPEAWREDLNGDVIVIVSTCCNDGDSCCDVCQCRSILTDEIREGVEVDTAWIQELR